MPDIPFSNLYSEGLADQLLKDRISDMLLAQRKSILGLLDTVVRGVANPNLQSLILFCETKLKNVNLGGQQSILKSQIEYTQLNASCNDIYVIL